MSSIMVNHAPSGGPKILSLARKDRWLSAPGFGLFRSLQEILLRERMKMLELSSQSEIGMHIASDFREAVCIHTCVHVPFENKPIHA